MNDPPLLTPYWSSAFAKQMKPPTLAPYMVALLCMGPCHGQAQTRDPTIGFSPPALLYLRPVIFSAWCKLFHFSSLFFILCICFTLNSLQFPASDLFFLLLLIFLASSKRQHFLWLQVKWDSTRVSFFFHVRKLICVCCLSTAQRVATQGARADIFLSLVYGFFKAGEIGRMNGGILFCSVNCKSIHTP